MFQNPKKAVISEQVPFSQFLKDIDDGKVMQVEIIGNDIEGILSDGTTFKTYAPNDPNLVEKLTSRGVTITASPISLTTLTGQSASTALGILTSSPETIANLAGLGLSATSAVGSLTTTQLTIASLNGQ